MLGIGPVPIEPDIVIRHLPPVYCCRRIPVGRRACSLILWLAVWTSLHKPGLVAGRNWLPARVIYVAIKTNTFRNPIVFPDPPPPE